eukprot:TRINITY_DN90932_c0_g1_i1.p1 TRINITY_DN90932_c0_g1~~TRINITY_DN90932_c0_g1_i1.p1  ORF type:complete len:687 (+),score=187.43 TRINITY_DN90932_c0_g1_i1:73-2133(+)
MASEDATMAAKPRRSSAGDESCFCGTWRRFGVAVRTFCEGAPPEDEPAWARLERMHEERQKHLAELNAKDEQRKAENAKQAKAYEDELAQIQKQRATMPDEELTKDIMKQYETLGLLKNFGPDAFTLTNSEEASTQAAAAEEQEAPESEPGPPKLPAGPYEAFLESCLIHLHEVPRHALRPPYRCFGELPVVIQRNIALVRTFAEALEESAAAADKAAAELVGQVKKESPRDLNKDLDRLIAKYARAPGFDSPSESTNAPELDENEQAALDEMAAAEAAERAAEKAREWNAELLELYRNRGLRHRDVASRLATLVPCLEGCPASSRLAMALAGWDSDEPACTTTTSGSVEPQQQSALAHLSIDPHGHHQHASLTLPPVWNALSTADACWAICSEKRHLIVEHLLPGARAEGRWAWPDLRKAGVGYWLCGPGSEDLLESLVTKLAQSALQSARKSGTGSGLFGRQDSDVSCHLQRQQSTDAERAARRKVDDAFFWYVVMGTKLPKLRMLLKTGVLKGEPHLSVLLNHEKAEEESFMRKNAFYLVKMHRYQLAAAVFMLAGCVEDAAKMVVRRMHDLQLGMVLTRKHPVVKEGMLREVMDELKPPASDDPWLGFLLNYHAGDPRRPDDSDGASPISGWSFDSQAMSSEVNPIFDAEAPLFDGALAILPELCSTSAEGLDEVRRLLRAR